MSDLISRQSVIDALDEQFWRFLNIPICKEIRNVAKETIKALPSAQQWIPCSERLPEPDERVLVYTVGKEFHVWDAMPHRGESYAWEDEEGLYHSLYEVDLWMPLPEPYEEE